MISLTKRIASGLIASLATVCTLCAQQAPTTDDSHAMAAGSDLTLFDMQQANGQQKLHLIAGRSVVLHSKMPIKRVYIGDQNVVDSFTADNQELVLTAKTPGISSMVMWDVLNRSHVYTVAVDMDGQLGQDALKAAFPDAHIAVESREGKLFLTGDVDSQAVCDAAAKLAETYSKQVVNGLHVKAPRGKQVELKLRIVEVDRSKAEQFGFNFMTAGRTASQSSTQQFSNNVNTAPISQGQPVSVSDPFNFFAYNYKLALGATLKDLEQRQVLQVLAEPTLSTMSGVTARFLSGGEFPVPVVQGTSSTGASVSIVYKPYGVKVDFLPTVNKDGTIHMKIAPEVSALDYTNSVTLSGTTVPALSTRRAETEVEIRDGDTYAISGLLDHRTTDALAKMPGIASIPILGQLFKSKNLNGSTVELVVMVTAHVVDPLTQNVAPADPKMVVPNLDTTKFDGSVRKTENVKAPEPTGAAKENTK